MTNPWLAAATLNAFRQNSKMEKGVLPPTEEEDWSTNAGAEDKYDGMAIDPGTRAPYTVISLRSIIQLSYLTVITCQIGL